MQRNIKLLKIILPLNSSWFWIGIWLPFYLSITNYAGIGFLESTIFLFGFLIEIPTGVTADIFGKKRSLIGALIFATIGNFVMAFATIYIHIYLSVTLLVIGTALRSGTDQALLFDSLKQIKKESIYQKEYSRISIYKMLAMSAAGLVGVYAYSISPGLPFFITGVATTIATFLALFIQEPVIDSEKYSLRESFKQNFAGIGELKKVVGGTRVFGYLLVASSILYIFIEMQDPAILVVKGISDSALGILYSIIPLVTAFGTFVFERVTTKSKDLNYKNYLFLIIVIFIMLFLSPIVGLGINILFLLYRNLFYDTLDIVTSNLINQEISSKSRATTLSTYSMIKSLPYVVFGFLIGLSSDRFGADNTGSAIALIGLALFLAYFVYTTYSHRSFRE